MLLLVDVVVVVAGVVHDGESLAFRRCVNDDVENVPLVLFLFECYLQCIRLRSSTRQHRASTALPSFVLYDIPEPTANERTTTYHRDTARAYSHHVHNSNSTTIAPIGDHSSCRVLEYVYPSDVPWDRYPNDAAV